MTDIAPQLWEKISAEFETALKTDEEIARLYEKIRSGKATYEEALRFSERVGMLSSSALTDNITAEVLPDGKLYYNIAERTVRPALERDYALISDAAADVQKSLNEAAGIGLNPVSPELNEDRLSGLIDTLTEDGKPFDEVRKLLEAPVVNFCQNVVDESVEKNAEAAVHSGLKAVIIRRRFGKGCDLCARLTGVYDYGSYDYPDEIFSRHENCRCLVTVKTEKGGYQDVWSKVEYKSQKEARLAREREIEEKEYLKHEMRNRAEQYRDTKDNFGIIADKIASGEYTLKYRHQKYLQHVKGNPQYENAVKSRKRAQSFLTVSEEEAQKIVRMYAGTGTLNYVHGAAVTSREYVTVDRIIGEYNEGGKWYKTKRIAIFYAKDGTHIVPVKEID